MLDEETRAKIYEHYQKGQGSIQDIARVYRCSVEEVLQIIGQDELLRVEVQGDMIDPSEAGPNVQLNYGEQFNVPFTTN